MLQLSALWSNAVPHLEQSGENFQVEVCIMWLCQALDDLYCLPNEARHKIQITETGHATAVLEFSGKSNMFKKGHYRQ